MSYTVSKAIGEYPKAEEDGLVTRLAKALVLTELLTKEYQEIRNKSLMLGADWSSTLESLLAHMEIDLDWLRRETKKLMGG